MKIPSLSNLPKYGDNYTGTKLFDKIGKVAKNAGVKTVYASLLLYYALMDNEVPLKDKAVVLGALGYFILSIDLIPDMTPVFGYSDDAGAMILALKTIWNNITPSTHSQARKRLESWFGKVSDKDIKLF